ncbi:hypothetical protein A3770_07p48500 [Chloropicon primus]|uniref:FAS1 domain-containing protein n=1 Tax=Chloropicon primus TaxID=1764295 RepID=A0A5B8MSJ7_9CHLO|nr:hypothetical protein A3770_07p48500 [Chloropicon primus]|mmetsp:Transcript_3564/g.10052  ORF Transcript_3564/g.10052 Transcript_3564/m.10052 type:complete len:246 (-) Transcript_3564:315-1052(-)|eukprot:QDZ22332.1 hypothetical protein A3770_07p48500 [Chloropicon primus]
MRMRMRMTTCVWGLAACLVAAVVFGPGCAPSMAQDVSKAPEDYNIRKDECIFEDRKEFLLDQAKGNDDFSTLVKALESVPDLIPIFENKKDKLTILAPTNEAFATFFKDFNSSAEEFLKDKNLVKLVLSYHVIPSVVPYSDMEMALKPLFMSQVGVTTSVPGDDLSLTRVKPAGKDEYVIRSAGYASAAYLSPDSVWACNGVINPINYVLVPRQATITKPSLRIANGGSGGNPKDGDDEKKDKEG